MRKRKRQGGEVSAVPLLILQDLTRFRISGGAVSWQIQDWPLHFQSADCQPQWDPANPFSLPAHPSPALLCSKSPFLCFTAAFLKLLCAQTSLGPANLTLHVAHPQLRHLHLLPRLCPAGPSKHTLNRLKSAQNLSRAGFSTGRSSGRFLGLNQAALSTAVFSTSSGGLSISKSQRDFTKFSVPRL